VRSAVVRLRLSKRADAAGRAWFDASVEVD
jgi:hypothetical protein